VATDGTAGFAAEAAGLRWLAAAPDGARPAVPAVLAVGESFLVIEWTAEDGPSPEAAGRFGADLARLHGAGAEHFGAPWPGSIARLPLPNDEADDWPQWYATCRLLPYARLAMDSGALSAGDVGLVESVCAQVSAVAGPAEPPSRIHGDCWAGNVLWSGSRGCLIDPAAHGGNRETDLAMLSLFGAPHLDEILAAYQEVTPLADGWRDRVPLHQLHPLLVHVCLFGASYRQQLLAAARGALRA
jgi:fructosamine-3-kinase